MSIETVRTRPPAPGKLRPFSFPEFKHTQLANGLRIFAARLPRVPLVSLEMLLPAGSQCDHPDRPGLASFHSGLLEEGTVERSALEIAGLVERFGGSLASGAGWNMAYVNSGLLSKHLGFGVDLLAEITRSPAFPIAEIDRARHDRLAEILRRKKDPSALAGQFFVAALYPGTPYGKPRIGSEESLKRFDKETLEAFYRHHIGPRGSSLIAVGDIDPETFFSLVDEKFGDWAKQPPPSAPVIEAVPLAGIEVHIVDRKSAAQTQIQVGHVGVPRTHPDFQRLLLLNAIFGGKFTSRINLNLREKHGFTYGAQSHFTQRVGPGPFITRTAVATEVAGAAVEQLLFEMRRIREERVSREELEDTQNYLIGVNPYTLQTIGDLAKRLENIAIFELPLDYYESYPGCLADITREDILETARRHLDPDHSAIIAVGPAETLRPQLETFGPVQVHQP